MLRTEFCRSASLFQKPKFVRITKNQLIFSTKLRFLKIYCRLPRNCKYHFPLLTSNFRRAGDWVSPLSRRYKDRKFEKTKLDLLLRKCFVFLAPLRGRGRGRGGLRKPPRFWSFWLPKVHTPNRFRLSICNILQ